MDVLISVVLPLGLAFIMFTLGVGLTPADFARVGQRPLAFFIGALNQSILLPLVTFICVLAFGIRAEMAVGFMILAACPGGVTSNVISKLAKGDVALSVSLTAVISLASVVTVPLILGLSMGYFMGDAAPAIDITKTAVTMFALTVVPVTLGLGARAMAPAAMTRAEPKLSAVATILFAVIVLAALAANWALFVENIVVIGPALLVLLAALTTIGFVVPRLLGRSVTEAKTISVETGVQNSTLGIAVAAIIVGGEGGFTAYALPSAVYGILMYLIILPVVLKYRRIGTA
ncbi:MAG: bile acid:sodium symporter [Roseobacter sp.]|uniref:bile acid:sodium symporter family protein n=1 Tax=Sulfitobacter pontiacus TaxID=60137 RepID=UPI000C3D695C|nr:bile acid:sodium symporter family protein [Sulfitobacter pontiacus]MAN09540.1 bile acid:sodium symporter [Roseobacter sp.]HBU55351.1 bile acid:sodium symporter [Sulfitobacter sp.]MBG64295.1 bile acid:sodium symporter [Roseobacter sp.]HCI98769.1 bile acid:sodium symporter [Sulfitobacter sp.]HJO49113.1 bile acid:sodium symporter family protein [Sulfitobacter pontiacus]